ncbi:MAG: 23S rRNA (adenine(2503)-C(2))-methyltransferase RlmN, partial [Actinomycetota bacterium]
MRLPFEVPGPPYRARQIAAWIYTRFARTFEEMTDIPASMREEFASRVGEIRPSPAAINTADDGDTIKALFPGSYEAVAMRYPGGRRTVCISSQAGCGLGCTFCATGQMGLIRNLEAWEIVAQVLWAGAVLGERPSNVVMMG